MRRLLPLAAILVLSLPACGSRPRSLPDLSLALADDGGHGEVPAEVADPAGDDGIPAPDAPDGFDAPDAPDALDATDGGEPADPGPGPDGGPPVDPGTTDPGTTDPGTTDPGTVDPGAPEAGQPEDLPTDPGAADPDGAAPDAAEPPDWVDPVVDQAYLPTLLALIQGAKSSVDVAHFEFNQDSTVDQVRDALAQAVQRGVAVRVLIEASLEDNPPRVAELKGLGVDAKLGAATKTLHVKLVIADGARALLGSTNLSGASMKANHETNLRVTAPALVGFLKTYYEGLWTNPALNSVPTPASTATTRIFGDHSYFPNVSPVVAGATQRLWVLMYGMSWNDAYPDGEPGQLIDAVAAAAKRGVDTRVVLEHSDWDPNINAANLAAATRLQAAGVDVRWDSDQVTSHAKLVVADDAVVVSTCNWSYSGMALQHEAGAITRDPDTVQALATYFQQVRAQGQPFVP